MNRSESRRRWQRVAEGQLDALEGDELNLHAWIREVATSVLAADDEPRAVQRPQAIMRAVGLAGKQDPYAPLRELVEEHTMFDAYDDDGRAIAYTQGQVVGQLVAVARARGLLSGTYADDHVKARDLLRNVLTKKV